MAKIVLTSLIIGLGAIAQMAQAQVHSPIVGFNTITALGNSDTRFSVPLHRPSAFQGVVESVSGNVITISGLPGWTANQFVYSAGVQSNVYYLSVGSGNKEGMYYTVTANSADSGTADTSTLTVDTAGDTIDGVSGVVSGDAVQIIPYWSLGTLFPGGQGLSPAATVAGSGNLTQIITVSHTTPGVNLSASSTYYYYPGNGSTQAAGWRRVGGGFANLKDDDVILPDSPVIIRQQGVGTSAIVTATGTVGTGDRKYVIGTLQDNTPQDNWVAVNIPVPLTLAQSNLAQSGAFTHATSAAGSGGDQLLVFNDAVAAMNKSVSATYYYYGGNGDTLLPGWRRVGGGFANLFDNTIVFQPGSGYIIRKQAAATASTGVWTVPVSF